MPVTSNFPDCAKENCAHCTSDALLHPSVSDWLETLRRGSAVVRHKSAISSVTSSGALCSVSLNSKVYSTSGCSSNQLKTLPHVFCREVV